MLGGGYPRGGFALLHASASLAPEDLDLVLTPTLLNFLYRSRGVLAVLPPRDSPRAFRSRLTRHTTRRRFDLRVRVVEYVGEDDDAPFVVSLAASVRRPPRRGAGSADLDKMVVAERAVRGARPRPFLEMNAIEVSEILFGPETAARMRYHGVKRARQVGNLVLGIVRPGLQVLDAVRSMADVAIEVRHDEMGIAIRGLHPSFPNHLVLPDAVAGPPHVTIVPRP